MDVHGCYQFRVTRNSDLFVDDEEVDDLLRALEGELAHRRYGAAVRLEVSTDCPPDLDAFLMRQFDARRSRFLRVSGPVNLNRLEAIHDLVDGPISNTRSSRPACRGAVAAPPTCSAVIRRSDVLLHHPFQCFAPVLDFLRRRRRRSASPGHQADAVPHRDRLAHRRCAGRRRASRQGSHGRRRTAGALRRRSEYRTREPTAGGGAHVVYGVVGHKTHAKMSMVVRREADGCAATATSVRATITPAPRASTRTTACSPAIRKSAQDVHKLFLQLTASRRAAADKSCCSRRSPCTRACST